MNSSNHAGKYPAELEFFKRTAGLKMKGILCGHLSIVITHGDFDHTGNAAYLQQAYEVKIAVHNDDVEMTEKGDMFSNRKQPNILVQKIVPLLFGFGRNERFKPEPFTLEQLKESIENK